MPSPTQVFTTLFEAALEGDEAAQKRLFSVLYSELHRLAHAAMRKERPGHLLQTTALVHKAYMRLVEDEAQRWENRAHFYKVAAGAMRRILVGEAGRGRAARAEVRGRRAPLPRRTPVRAGRGDSRGVGGHREARLAIRQGLAPPGDRIGNAERTLRGDGEVHRGLRTAR